MKTHQNNTDKRLQVVNVQALIFCSLLLALSCTKEKETEHNYPRVVTGVVTNINAGGATFNGSFLQAGNSEVIDHGFVFGANSLPSIQNSEKISLGSSNGRGSYTTTVNFAMTAGKTYYVSAYAQNKDRIFYAEPVSFVSMGSAAPEIFKVVPGEGLRGDTVVIRGRYFSGLLLQNNTVKFGDSEASIISASDTALTVRVPTSNGLEHVNVLVITAEQMAQKTVGFRYIIPVITEITPLLGRVGDRITIKVNPFNNALPTSVFLGDFLLKMVSSAKNEVIVEIPDNIPALVTTITIIVDDHSIKSTEEFELISPWIKLKTLPMPGRRYSTAYTDNGNGYVCFGSANVTNTWPYSPTYRDWWKYNHFTDTWQQMIFNDGFIGSARLGALCFTINNQLFVGYGIGGYDYTDFYKIEQNNWILKNDQYAPYSPFLGAHVNSFVVNDAAYVCGGSYNYELWQYTPTDNNWIKKTIVSSMQTRCYGISFSYNDKGYVGLGRINNQSYNDIWEYNVMSDTWSLKVNGYPDGATSGAISFVINNRVFIGLGTQSNRYSRTIWEYFPENDIWENVTTIPASGRDAAFIFVLDDKAYIGSGYNGQFLTDFYEFDPSKL